MAKKVSRIDVVEDNILKGLREEARETRAQTELLKKSLLALNDVQKKIKETASTLKSDLDIVDPSTLAGLKKMNQLQTDSNKLLIQNEKIIQEKARTTVALERAEQAQVRTERLLNKETSKQTTEYQRQSKVLNDLRKEYKDLALQNKANTKEARNLLSEITALDTKLKKVDATVGQHQRKVGHYTSTIGSLKNGLFQLAGGFGVFNILRSSLTTVTDFETQVADLSAVTGQTGKDLDFLKDKAVDFSKKYGESAASIAEAFKLAGSARPELLKNGAALSELTEKAIILSKASGDDVPTSIKNLTGTLNAFELDASKAGEVMDVLANAAQLGSQEIPYLTEAFNKFGAIAKSQGIGVAESAAAVELLGEKMPDAATAGTGLRNVMLKLMAPDALGKDAQDKLKSLGINFAAISDKSKPFSERLEALKPLLKDNAGLVKVFGNENALAAQILLSNTDKLKTFTDGLDKNGTALDQANTKSKTLAEAGKRLKANFDAFILNMVNGTGAASGLSSVLDFLANNFDAIVSVVKKVVQVFVTYKAVMMALQMKERISDFVQYKKALKESGDAMKEGTESAKSFGGALKGIGLAVGLTILLEVGAAIWDIASGAKQAREDLEKLQRQAEKSGKQAQGNVQEIQQKVNNQIAEYNRQLKTGKITQKEFNQLQLEAQQNALEQLQTNKKLAYERFNTYKQDKALLTGTSQMLNGELATRKQIGEYLQKKYGSGQDYASTLANINASIKGAAVRIQEYSKGIETLDESTKDAAADLEVLNTETSNSEKKTKSATEAHKKSTEAIQYETKALEEQAEVRNLLDPEANKKALLVDEERALLAAEIAVIESEISLEKARQSGDQERINAAEKVLIEAKKSLIDKQLAYDIASGDGNVNEEDKKKKQADLDKLQLDSKETTAKENFKIDQKYIELGTKFLEDQIDKRIKLIDKEIEASQKKQDMLREMAVNGNIQAKESLAEQERIEQEAIQKKEQLEKRKQRIQMIGAILTAYSNALNEGKSGFEAIASAVGQQTVLEALLEGIGSFYDGTEDTGTVNNPLDSNGGRLAVLHNNERVMTAEQNKALSGLSNEEVVKVVQTSKLNEITSGSFNNIDNLAVLNGLKSELSAVKKAIQDKPESNIELGQIYQTAMEIVHTTKKGNKRTQSTFIVK